MCCGVQVAPRLRASPPPLPHTSLCIWPLPSYCLALVGSVTLRPSPHLTAPFPLAPPCSPPLPSPPRRPTLSNQCHRPCTQHTHAIPYNTLCTPPEKDFFLRRLLLAAAAACCCCCCLLLLLRRLLLLLAAAAACCCCCCCCCLLLLLLLLLKCFAHQP